MFRLGFRVSLWISVLTAFWLVGACSGGNSKQEGNTTQDGSTSSDGGTTNTNNNAKVPDRNDPPGDQKSSGAWPPPSGMAAMEFSVDDSANKTYKEGQLFWNGSFVYDKATNTVTFSSAWQPTDGPFPPLYDDGPIDQGGHEPVGAKAGDHIWGVVVFVKPDPSQKLEFEYGLINDNNHWLWEGPNGLVVIKKGATDVVEAKGLKLPPHGNIDVKITLNLAKVQADFAVDDIKNPPLIFIKGTMTNWAHVQVQDRGSRGDDKEGDGVLTFVQSQNLDYSPHFGLLQHERHMQFVYQFNSMTGREYKDVDDNALQDGVEAWADCNGDGKFTADEKQTIVMEKDSRGAVKNTTIIVCEGKEPPCSKADCDKARCKDKAVCQGCQDDNDCTVGNVCNTATGQCEKKQTTCTKADCAKAECKDDPVCQCKADSDCASGEVCNTTTGRCLSKTCTPSDCGEARCKSDPVCTSSAQGPVIYFVVPPAGSKDGGTTVTITGDRFQQGAKVEFGGKAATNVKVDSATKITCTTPAGSPGSVDVTVINPDSRRNTYPQGYKYDGSANPNTFSISSVVPAYVLPAGGTTVKLYGGGFQSGATVDFGGSAGTQVKVVSQTEIEVVVPAGTKGKVDVKVSQQGKSTVLSQGLTYIGLGASVGWCNVQWPKAIPDSANNIPDAQAGQPSPAIYGWVYKKGSTDRPGEGPGVVAHVGIGPVGSNPATDTRWQWWPAQFFGDKPGLGGPHDNDEYKGSVVAPSAGTYNYAYRFSGDGVHFWYCTPAGNDANTSYDPGKAPTLQAK